MRFCCQLGRSYINNIIVGDDRRREGGGGGGGRLGIIYRSKTPLRITFVSYMAPKQYISQKRKNKMKKRKQEEVKFEGRNESKIRGPGT